MQIIRPAALAAALILTVSPALAAPAPYYQYKSKLDGKFACSQTPMGNGWERFSGPYRDVRCEKPIVVK